MKLDIAEDDIPLIARALEHYAAYPEATKRRMIGTLPPADRKAARKLTRRRA